MTAAARGINFIILLVTVDLVLSAIFNDTLLIDNKIDTRRAKKNGDRHRSTSSSSNQRRSSESESSANSLDMTTDSSSSDGDNSTKRGHPKSSLERHGWRKWHRKCTPCPEQKLKWRDPSIKWICGGYQRARRSFKSLCMMHYRNCQDGTMFVKIGDYRCQNDSEHTGWRYGEHFFYDYNVRIRDDSSKSRTGDSSSEKTESFDSSKYRN